MTTLTSFLANRIEGSSIEGLCKCWLCIHFDGSSCEKAMFWGCIRAYICCNVFFVNILMMMMMHVVRIIWHHPLQCLPRDGSHPHRWEENTEIRFKECAAGWREGYRRSRGGDKSTNHNDRDSLPTVAYSIQYSWKCDTFPLQWMPLTLKPILSTSTGCSFQSVIEFLKKSIWLQGHSFAM